MGRRRTLKRKQPSLPSLRTRLKEILQLRDEAKRRGDEEKYERQRTRFEKTMQEIRRVEEARRRVTREFIELANFDFTDGSWAEFYFMLQTDCNVLTEGRPDLKNVTRPDDEDLGWTQRVVRRALKGVVEKGYPPKLTLLEMAQHAEHVKHHVTDVLAGTFRRYTVAEKYHDVTFWEILSVDRTRIKRCDPECGCGLYFWDNTRNRSKKWHPGDRSNHGLTPRKRKQRAEDSERARKSVTV